MKKKEIIKVFLMLPFVSCIVGCSSLKPKETGLKDGQLRPCPPAPKCVSTYYKKGVHAITPLKYTGTKDEAYEKIIRIINSIKKSKIVVSDPDYIHAQVEVTVFKWIDDVEFLFSRDEKVIDFSSSASAPVGFWDWGENRRRAENIKKMFAE